MDRNIFLSLDIYVILYSASMATLMSILITWRARNAQKMRGEPLSSWAAVIPDTLIGTITGVLFAQGVPALFKALQNFSGVSFCAGAGGILGPKLWDMINARGEGVIIEYLAKFIPGLKASGGANKGGGSNDGGSNAGS